MSLPYNSFVEQPFSVVPSLSFVRVDDCILHPKRRRIRHLTGISMRNMSPDDNVIRRRPSIASSQRVRKNSDMLINGIDTPLERQVHLQTINNESFFNTFISFHYANKERYGQAFHVTEVAHESLNPNFQEFNLEALTHSKDSEFVLKVWTSSKASPESWSLFRTYHIILSTLLYLNKSLDEVRIEVKNSILISLGDGVYVLPVEGFNVDDYKLVVSDFVPYSSGHKITVPSLSFDLSMKLNNLDTVIEDLKKSKKVVSSQINHEFEQLQMINSYKQDKLRDLILKQKEINFIKQERLEELKKIKLRKLKLIQSKKLQQDTSHSSTSIKLKEEYSSVLINSETTSQELLLERSRIVKQVLEIFPKSEIQTWLSIPDFEILPVDLNLSNLTTLINASNPKTIEELNAGFGYISHIAFLLSRYLAIPLKYRIQSFGSTSYIIDKISQINQRQIFPLFYTNHFYRFQYAVILLNRNIQDILRNSYHY